jgi:hypothetical protein
MRTLGYVLLIAGFFMLCLGHVLGAGVRPVILAQYEKLSPDRTATYTTEQVQAHIRETAISFRPSQRLNIYYGVMMLCGGLVLARSR